MFFFVEHFLQKRPFFYNFRLIRKVLQVPVIPPLAQEAAEQIHLTVTWMIDVVVRQKLPVKESHVIKDDTIVMVIKLLILRTKLTN